MWQLWIFNRFFAKKFLRYFDITCIQYQPKNMHRICIKMYLIMYCNNSLIQFSDTLELFQFVPGSKWADDNRILSDHIKPLAHTSLSNSDMANAGSTEFCLYVLFFIPFTTTAQQGLTNLIQLIVLQLKSCSALIRRVFNLFQGNKELG